VRFSIFGLSANRVLKHCASPIFQFFITFLYRESCNLPGPASPEFLVCPAGHRPRPPTSQSSVIGVRTYRSSVRERASSSSSALVPVEFFSPTGPRCSFFFTLGASPSPAPCTGSQARGSPQLYASTLLNLRRVDIRLSHSVDCARIGRLSNQCAKP